MTQEQPTTPEPPKSPFLDISENQGFSGGARQVVERHDPKLDQLRDEIEESVRQVEADANWADFHLPCFGFNL